MGRNKANINFDPLESCRFYTKVTNMVDLEVANVKKVKKNKRKGEEETTIAVKKIKKEKSILKDKNETEGVEKKSLKFNETVKVREIAKAPKKSKTEKLEQKIKQKKVFKKE